MPVNADAVPTEGLELFKRFERGDLELRPVACHLLKSTIAIRLSRLRAGANSAASQVEPSLHSPSLKRVTTRWGIALILEANAIPVATDKPWPKEPVAASIPGTQRGEGCSGNGEPA